MTDPSENIELEGFHLCKMLGGDYIPYIGGKRLYHPDSDDVVAEIVRRVTRPREDRLLEVLKRVTERLESIVEDINERGSVTLRERNAIPNDLTKARAIIKELTND